MLISFSVSNFLSFNNFQTFSLTAGKSRLHDSRIYQDSHIKLIKCATILGPNGSGKSNLITAMKFFQSSVVDGIPTDISQLYHRQNANNRDKDSVFEIEFLLNNSRFLYGFHINLAKKALTKEYLYKLSGKTSKKVLFIRDLDTTTFIVGDYFRNKSDNQKLQIHGDDSILDSEYVFLSLINHGKSNMFSMNPELEILRQIYSWIQNKINILTPETFLSGGTFFPDSTTNKTLHFLKELGTEIDNIRFVDVPWEVAQSRIPKDEFISIITDLETSANQNIYNTIIYRFDKELYLFEYNDNKLPIVSTIEFNHRNTSEYYKFNEESDGTIRIMDLLEILLSEAHDNVYIVDEINRCLHPMLTTKFFKIFLTLANTRNTQLIATTHELQLLLADDDNKNCLLRSDEVFFIYKTSNGESIIHSYKLNKKRSDKKIYTALLNGDIENALPEL